MTVSVLTAVQAPAQSTYEPYTFTTLAGGGGFVSVDVVISGPEGFGDWPRTVRAGANACLRLNGTQWPVSEARRALCLHNGRYHRGSCELDQSCRVP